MSLLFEVEDLAVASPATVSRCGMVYNDWKNLGWEPYVQSWLAKRKEKRLVDPLKTLFEKYVTKVLEFRHKNCKELIPTGELNAVTSLCYLLEALATVENGVDPADADNFERMLELWFLFSLIWSLGASVNEDGRKKMDNFIREMEGQFPPKDTVYEYYVDTKTKNWTLWEDKLKGAWRYPSKLVQPLLTHHFLSIFGELPSFCTPSSCSLVIMFVNIIDTVTCCVHSLEASHYVYLFTL